MVDQKGEIVTESVASVVESFLDGIAGGDEIEIEQSPRSSFPQAGRSFRPDLGSNKS